MRCSDEQWENVVFSFWGHQYDFQISPRCRHFEKEQILQNSATTQPHRSTQVTLVIGSHALHRRPWLNPEVGVWKLSHLHTPASYLIIHLLRHTAGGSRRQTEGEAVNKRGRAMRWRRRRRKKQQNSQMWRQTHAVLHGEGGWGEGWM